MNIQLVNLTKQYSELSHEIEAKISLILRSGQYINGPEVKAFEEEFAGYCGTKYAVGVGNGTDALVLSLNALGIGEGDEVITTPFTFFATAEAIVRVGAKPVFVDVDVDTFNISMEGIKTAITSKTKAVIPVHIFGLAVDMVELLSIAKENKLKVIEDACQAVGASIDGKVVGGFGDVGCFSFFPTKNLGTYGDGGMVTTNDPEIYEKIKMLRFHGQKVKYNNEVMGYNSRLDELHAGILREKLKHIDEWNQSRRNIAQKYRMGLKECSDIAFQKQRLEEEHVYHLFSILSDRREVLSNHLKASGVASAVYYSIPLHLQKALAFLGHQKGDFPNSEYLSESILAIPIYPELTDGEVEYIIEKLKEVL